MKSRLCYAWFGDEDIKRLISAAKPKGDNKGTDTKEPARNCTSNNGNSGEITRIDG
ncbi:hypothetical protein OKA05_10985 [Luteolibacter arcticus]|uniref:Uncharacterized protein n=1 Tax=Luteolibacter arcticus TaxID=1581411 RepID=A0ABT3GHU6_9BACT|nr:hypothetical protein [Luteolibacter arcticus]MCW1923078.1 hypothetical protein [Luteolibacter arcticus]